MPIQLLYYIHIPIAVFISFHIFSSSLEKRKYYILKLISTTILYFGFAIIYKEFLFPYINNTGFYQFSILPYYLLILCIGFICYKNKYLILMFSLASCIVSHVHETISLFIISSNIDSLLTLFLIISTYLIGYTILYFFVAKIFKKEDVLTSTKMKVFYSIFYIISVSFLSIYRRYVYTMIERTDIIVNLFTILFGFTLLALILGIGRYDKSIYENKMIEEIIKVDQKQKKELQKNIEIINRKIHDLKYHIGDSEYNKDLQKAIQIYDNSYNYDSKVLNVILMEKNLLCDEYKIFLSCNVNEQNIGFINNSDLRTLLGNALDNAIEAVRKLDENASRYITLNINSKGNMLHIHIENPYLKGNEFDENHIKTSKKNKANHGYGLKSIKYITENYNGEFSFEFKEDIFVLNVLIPGK